MSPFVRWRRKALNLLLVLILVLVLVNMRTLSSIRQHNEAIEDLEAEIQRIATMKKLDKEFLLKDRKLHQLVANMSHQFNQLALLDWSGEYVILENFLAPNGRTWQEGHDVTLATHCTSNNLHYLPQLSKRWQGPVSAAVFTYDEDFLYTLSAILHLRFCYPSVSKYVTFHLSYPKCCAPVNPSSLLHVAQRRFTCSEEPKADANQYVPNHQIGNGTEYPINMLRSLSVKMAVTSHVFPVDVDVVPSGKLRASFIQHENKFPRNITDNSSSAKLAYIVPVFEIQRGVAIPWSKPALLEAWARRYVRPFQWTQCFSRCEWPTDYKRWMALPQSEELQAAYVVSYQPRYEPYYIAERSSLPLFDERFKQFGANRFSQVCEMYVAGYEFVVLNIAFLVHDGFKNGSDLHPTWREETEKNQEELYEEFQHDLKQRYPGTTRNCSHRTL